MATIINNPRSEPERAVLVDTSDGSGGWAVAVIILLVVIAGGVFWYMRYYRAAAPASTSSTNIQVTLPAGTQPSNTPATQ